MVHLGPAAQAARAIYPHLVVTSLVIPEVPAAVVDSLPIILGVAEAGAVAPVQGHHPGSVPAVLVDPQWQLDRQLVHKLILLAVLVDQLGPVFRWDHILAGAAGPTAVVPALPLGPEPVPFFLLLAEVREDYVPQSMVAKLQQQEV